ncbi:MAG: hypothetical protein WBG38_17110, partial [Nodosilinea sp.]
AQTATKSSEHGIPLGETIPIKARPRRIKTLPGSSTVNLSDLISDRARDVLAGGGGGHSDRSYAIVSLAREAFGWENWARENSIPLVGQTAKDLTLAGGVAHGADDDHIQRIMDGASLDTARPSCECRGDEFPWSRLRKLAPTLFDEKAPSTIKPVTGQKNLERNVTRSIEESVNVKNNLLLAASRVLHEKGEVGIDSSVLSYAGSKYGIELDKAGKLSVSRDDRMIFSYKEEKILFNRSEPSDPHAILADAGLEVSAATHAAEQRPSVTTGRGAGGAKSNSPETVELLNLSSLILSRAGQPDEAGGFAVQGRRNSVVLTSQGVLIATQEGRTVLKAKGADIVFSRPSESVLKDFRTAAALLEQPHHVSPQFQQVEA